MSDRKTCFVIGPIGEAGSESRRVADWLLKGIVKPVLESERFGYEVTRADECPDPGSITDQIISAVMEADLVVADLTSHNPNAFYELAIRHMAEKPVIHMIMNGQAIPFDTKDYRTILYDISNYDDIGRARQSLTDQVEAVSRKDYKVSNPVTKARGHRRLAASEDSRDQMVIDLMAAVAKLTQQVDSLQVGHLTQRIIPVPGHSVPIGGSWPPGFSPAPPPPRPVPPPPPPVPVPPPPPPRTRG